MTKFELEVQRFRDRADSNPKQYGEWECDYPYWNALRAATFRVIDSYRNGVLPSNVAPALLYVLARDNETEHVCNEIAKHPELLCSLARLALSCDDPDAKWQLAVAVGESQLSDAALLLHPYLGDADEYVRRRTLMVYAIHSPVDAERIALARLDDEFEYTRMSTLTALHAAGSSSLHSALDRLADDPNGYVRSLVRKLRASLDGR